MKHLWRILSASAYIALLIPVITTSAAPTVAAGVKPAAASSARLTVSRSLKVSLSPALRDLASASTPAQAHPSSNDNSPAAAPSGAAPMPAPILNFDGVKNTDNSITSTVPDAQGAVGANDYVQWVNHAYEVFNKTTGQRILGPVPGDRLWASLGAPCLGQDLGDPITLYDELAGRWFMSQYAVPSYPSAPSYICIAVSQTGDPTGQWYLYSFLWSYNKLNPGMKFAVWPDGYYMATDQVTPGTNLFASQGMAVFQRRNMLEGLPAQIVAFDLGNTVGGSKYRGALPADLDGPPPPEGSPEYFVALDHDANGNITNNLDLWQFSVNWTANPVTATVGLNGAPNAVISTTAFSSVVPSIPQPNTSQTLSPLSDRLMYRLQYRNFGDHESLVVNHTVLGSSNQAAIRWYEIRSPGSSPTIFQSGTHEPDAADRWVGSMAMDRLGDMALGYSVASATLTPTIKYAGRLVSDPPGQLPQTEQSLITGFAPQGVQTNSSDWGHYTAMAVDPGDDCTFWYTNEYYLNTSSTNNWNTRIGSFKFSSCTPTPAGIVSGVVSDASSHAPISSTLVFVGDYSATSDASGTYSVTVPAGTYTVSALPYGHQTVTVTGVIVPTGGQVTVNLPAQAAPVATISGTVKDNSGHGWPLYSSALIEATGGFSETIYTDPVQGTFSAPGLYQGIPYAFSLRAINGGYQPQTFYIASLSSSTTETWTLSVVTPGCSAAGYGPSNVYSYNFDTTASFTGSGDWQWGVPSSSPGPGSAYTPPNVWATNLTGNYSNNADDVLTSPVMNLSGLAGQTFTASWWQWLQTQPEKDTAQVQASSDSGATWTTVYGPVSGNVDTSGWKQHTLYLTSSYATSGFMIRYILTSDGSTTAPGWYVDNVSVSSLTCQVVTGGLLFGNVTDAQTGAGVVGARVSSVLSSTVTTVTQAKGVLPNVSDGWYFLFSPFLGSTSYIASGPSGSRYGTDTETANVVANAITTRNFILPVTVGMVPRLYMPLVFGNSGKHLYLSVVLGNSSSP